MWNPPSGHRPEGYGSGSPPGGGNHGPYRHGVPITIPFVPMWRPLIEYRAHPPPLMVQMPSIRGSFGFGSVPPFAPADHMQFVGPPALPYDQHHPQVFNIPVWSRAPTPAGMNHLQDIRQRIRAPASVLHNHQDIQISPRLSILEFLDKDLALPNEDQPLDPDISYEPQEPYLVDRAERIRLMFTKYADSSKHCIGSEGINSLCRDLQIHRAGVKMLILVWKMDAATKEYFTREEWQRGLGAMHADNLFRLKTELNLLENLWTKYPHTADFRDFYKFAFNYTLEDNQNTLNIQTFCGLLRIVLGIRYPDRVEKFTTFLTAQDEHMDLSIDVWSSFLSFCQKVNFPSLDNFMLHHTSWPEIFVDFVNWVWKERVGSSSSINSKKVPRKHVSLKLE